MNAFGYTMLYGETGREFAIAPNCHMTPYLPQCWANLACCLVHRTLHCACRNCHQCDPAVLEAFTAAARVVFGESDGDLLIEGLQKTNAFGNRLSPEAAADLKRQFVAKRYAAKVTLPLVDLNEAVEVDPEILADIETRINDELARTYREAVRSKPPSLADLGGKPNPSGAINLGSRWRPRGDLR